ncbi:hypothetical protein TPY_1454 [Sulfobacillus acidophilus TPY]|nr:hypothetical protein TPY_1454 [Sulfobacillus acidophilus TPY]
MKAYLEPDFLHDLQEKPFDALSAVNVARLPEQIRSITPFTPTDKEMLWRLQQQVQRQGELSLVNVEKTLQPEGYGLPAIALLLVVVALYVWVVG